MSSDQVPADVYPGIQAERVQTLNDAPVAEGGAYVLYWMQQSQRAELNHALEYAVRRANDLGQPLLVAFGLMDDYPEANRRHYHFMLQGLADVAAALEKRHVPFVVRRGHPDEVALALAQDASLVVCDRGYLRPQREWREHVAHEAPCSVVQVESDVVVPVELASDHQESAARTIRPKITRHLDRFLVELPKARLRTTDPVPAVDGEDLSDVDALLDRLGLDDEVPVVPLFTGGTTAGQTVLATFLADHLDVYAGHRNQPQTSDVSHMSKYLHFGQLSPVWIALEALKKPRSENRDDFLEELIIRRELPMNFVYYQRRYDAYSSLPDFARRTLSEHEDDLREHRYTRAQLEDARDPRRVLERGDARDEGHRLHAQLHADVLGQEDPGVVGHPAGRVRDGAPPEQQVLHRRSRRELVRERRLGVRPARPRLDRAGRVREGPLHERGRARAQGRPEGVRGQGRRARTGGGRRLGRGVTAAGVPPSVG